MVGKRLPHCPPEAVRSRGRIILRQGEWARLGSGAAGINERMDFSPPGTTASTEPAWPTPPRSGCL